MDKNCNDLFMGEWVYCGQYLSVHRTGWCTVSNREKVGLFVETEAEGVAKCRSLGLKLYGDACLQNFCNPVNGVHAEWCTGHDKQ